jgi:flagellar biosynthesis chaperone FliJ
LEEVNAQIKLKAQQAREINEQAKQAQQARDALFEQSIKNKEYQKLKERSSRTNQTC